MSCHTSVGSEYVGQQGQGETKEERERYIDNKKDANIGSA
jgi:hypothetical protein